MLYLSWRQCNEAAGHKTRRAGTEPGPVIQDKRRLLVVSCSQRKRADTAPLPAIDRYTGPTYQVIRRYLTTVAADNLDTLVLSAEYGLIDVRHPIYNYDRRMSASRARELQDAISASWALLTGSRRYSDIFISLGKVYQSAFDPCLSDIDNGVTLRVANGSQGKRLADLRRWLYRDAASVSQKAVTGGESRGPAKPVKIRGHEIVLRRDDVLATASAGVSRGDAAAMRCQAWYVPVDGSRISPKWLVSQVTGIAVRDFHSQDARRVLGELGIEVLPL